MSSEFDLFSAPTPLYQFLVLNEGVSVESVLKANPIVKVEPVEKHAHDDSCKPCKTCNGCALFKTYFMTHDRREILYPGYVMQCQVCEGRGCVPRKKKRKRACLHD